MLAVVGSSASSMWHLNTYAFVRISRRGVETCDGPADLGQIPSLIAGGSRVHTWTLCSLVRVVLRICRSRHAGKALHFNTSRLLGCSSFQFWYLTIDRPRFEKLAVDHHPFDVSTLRTWVGGCCTSTTMQWACLYLAVWGTVNVIDNLNLKWDHKVIYFLFKMNLDV